MEAIERITHNNDWLTIQFMLIGVLLFVVNYFEKERLRQLFLLPFNSLYFSNFENSHDYLFKSFSVIMFIISHITLSIFLYFLYQKFYPNATIENKNLYFIIFAIGIGYWMFRYTIGLFLSWVFDLQDYHSQIVYVKTSLYFSINLYLLILVVLHVYTFDRQGNFILLVLILYSILLAVRYVKFVFSTYNFSVATLFYFILYLCTLEIAPLLLMYKWSVGMT